MHYNVIIVGAGLSGNKIAESLSRKGLRILVIEEHTKIGYPQKCSGLVSERIFEFLPNIASEVTINEIKYGKLIFENKEVILKPKNKIYAIDRSKLDEILYKRALSFGCEYKLGERFIEARNMRDCVEVKTSKGIYTCDLIVGADGAFSKVAKNFNLFEETEYFIGFQSLVKGNFEKDLVEVWFGDEIAPKFFAWVIPLSENKARIGLATKERPLFYYKKFLKKRIKEYVQPDTAGIIKIGLIKNSVKDRVLLVGDAAMQVKPFTGGGIIYSLIASQIASLAILKAYKQKNYTKEFLKENYEDVWKEKLARSIKKGLLLRKLFYLRGDSSISFWFSLLPYFKNFIENLDFDFL